MDFTIKKYKQLLSALKDNNYQFQTFEQYIDSPAEKVVILRHDVDAKNLNSLQFAKIQNELGVKASYYFRMVKGSYDEGIMKEIKNLGHEIGYHYEDMDFAKKDVGGNPKEEDLYEKAFKIFKRNLEIIRKIYPVKTICMHGSPLSKFDNKALWKKYDYKSLGITGEPYYDIDFDKVFYITDTGRRWDGDKVSIRDRVNSNTFLDYRFHSTDEIIGSLKSNNFPDKVMMTFHPQRWNDSLFDWSKELLMQNIKNVVKSILLRRK
jgi:hypothetical protein